MVERVESLLAGWFGEEYLALYPERDDREAQRQVRFAAEVLAPHARQGRIGFLDLSCGSGRHAVALDAWGETAGVAGLERCLPFLGTARHRPHLPRPGYACGELPRLPFRDAAFGAAVSFRPLLGRGSGEEDAALLREARRVLAPGGALLSDAVNAPRLLAALATREEKTIAGRKVVIRRSYDAGLGRIAKEIEIGSGEEARCYRDGLRARTEEELRALHREAGLEVSRAFGDFDGSAFDPRRSPRLLLLAVRPGDA